MTACLDKLGGVQTGALLAPAVSLSDRLHTIDQMGADPVRVAVKLDILATEAMTQAFIMRGRAMPATALWSALNGAVRASRTLWDLFEKVDVIVMPMLAKAAPPIGSFPTDHADTDLHLERMTAFAPLASLANVSGFPAITLPFGADANGLPLPIQLVAPMGEDALLLSLAAQLEADGRWQHRHPIAGLAA